MSNKSKNQIATSANIVTIIRICLVPVFVVAFISPWPSFFPNIEWLETAKPWIALGIFVLLSATDSLDGYLARSRGEVTDFGKFLDPLADKILVCAALIALVELGNLPSWVVLVILIREFIVSGLRMLAATKGEVIAASWYGKAKTVAQIIAIILFILKNALSDYGTQEPNNPLYITAWIVMLIAIALTIISMIDYIYKCRGILGFTKIESCDDSVSQSDINLLATEIVVLAKNKNTSIACAESLTCGMISASIGSVSGASEIFKGGLSTYSYYSKSKLLDIDIDFLNKEGAVNSKTAETMASNSALVLDADISVSTTGVAGPNEDEAGNEVGKVFIGIYSNDSSAHKEFFFSGVRQSIRMKSTYWALMQLREALEKSC